MLQRPEGGFEAVHGTVEHPPQRQFLVPAVAAVLAGTGLGVHHALSTQIVTFVSGTGSGAPGDLTAPGARPAFLGLPVVLGVVPGSRPGALGGPGTPVAALRRHAVLRGGPLLGSPAPLSGRPAHDAAPIATRSAAMPREP